MFLGSRTNFPLGVRRLVRNVGEGLQALRQALPWCHLHIYKVSNTKHLLAITFILRSLENKQTPKSFFQLWADGLCKVCRVLRLDLSPCSGQVGFPAKKETYIELPFYHFLPGPISTRMWSKAARSWRCFTRPLRYWFSFDRRQHMILREHF